MQVVAFNFNECYFKKGVILGVNPLAVPAYLHITMLVETSPVYLQNNSLGVGQNNGRRRRRHRHITIVLNSTNTHRSNLYILW